MSFLTFLALMAVILYAAVVAIAFVIARAMRNPEVREKARDAATVIGKHAVEAAIAWLKSRR